MFYDLRLFTKENEGRILLTGKLNYFMVNRIQRRGCNSLARKIWSKTLLKVEKQLNRSIKDILEEIFRFLIPPVGITFLKKANQVTELPVIQPYYRAVPMAINWILEAARKKRGVKFVNALVTEFVDLYNFTGAASSQRNKYLRRSLAAEENFHLLYRLPRRRLPTQPAVVKRDTVTSEETSSIDSSYAVKLSTRKSSTFFPVPRAKSFSKEQLKKQKVFYKIQENRRYKYGGRFYWLKKLYRSFQKLVPYSVLLLIWHRTLVREYRLFTPELLSTLFLSSSQTLGYFWNLYFWQSQTLFTAVETTALLFPDRKKKRRVNCASVPGPLRPHISQSGSRSLKSFMFKQKKPRNQGRKASHIEDLKKIAVEKPPVTKGIPLTEGVKLNIMRRLRWTKDSKSLILRKTATPKPKRPKLQKILRSTSRHHKKDR
uniref:Ribosomal protein S7 n=1 Tax=Chromera velia TaxID=505693 RepID=D9IXD4_9ALVE|nr:ribosomal protein S7 [Chromera velia]ADJ66542.2 ribosomal protein S7 [Chromera velia]